MLERLARKHFERGRQFELQDREREAMESYQRACDLKPQLADPFLALGRMKALRGQLGDAIALLDAASERSDDPQIRQWRGYVYGRLRRYEEALADYRSVDDGTDPHTRVNIARMCLALGRFDEVDEVLDGLKEPSAVQLRSALPRYREFADEPSDDVRALRYLFGGSIVLGTLGDGGVRLAGDRYQMLTPKHCAATIQRFLKFQARYGWNFEAVAGSGPHHAPVAMAMAEILGLPLVKNPEPGVRVLLCSSVLKGPVESVRVSRPWRQVGADVMHMSLGVIPTGDPSPHEPELIGFVNRCAVPWYRVESFARLEATDEIDLDASWPGFTIGPAFIDPNSERVKVSLLEAFETTIDDPVGELVLGWYGRHRRVRAFDWE